MITMLLQLFIEEDISKCSRAVEQMKSDYGQYTQSQGKDHDELRRKVDVISDHWAWLKRIISKYENQHKSIGSQTDKFDDGKDQCTMPPPLTVESTQQYIVLSVMGSLLQFLRFSRIPPKFSVIIYLYLISRIIGECYI